MVQKSVGEVSLRSVAKWKSFSTLKIW